WCPRSRPTQQGDSPGTEHVRRSHHASGGRRSVADKISLAVGVGSVDAVGAVTDVVALLAGLLLTVGAGLEALDVGRGQVEVAVQIVDRQRDPILRDLMRANPSPLMLHKIR